MCISISIDLPLQQLSVNTKKGGGKINLITERTLQNRSRWAAALPWEVIILMLIWVAAGQFTPATVDSVRDIYQANAIAAGGAFPLTGPQLAHTIHLGPLWFYILAVPAAVFNTWGSIVLLVFIMSALKFWLAFVLGRELHSARLGLLFALFLALPSWSSTQLISGPILTCWKPRYYSICCV